MFALATTPGPEVLIVVGFRAAAAGTCGTYSGLSFLIQIAPVSVIPAGSCRHIFLLLIIFLAIHAAR